MSEGFFPRVQGPPQEPGYGATSRTVPGGRLPGLLQAHTSYSSRAVGLLYSRRGRRAQEVDLGGVQAATLRGDHKDIHCVTKWSKLGTRWEGSRWTPCWRSREAAEYVTAYCDGDYTTNLPLEDVTGGKAWVAYAYDGSS